MFTKNIKNSFKSDTAQNHIDLQYIKLSSTLKLLCMNKICTCIVIRKKKLIKVHLTSAKMVVFGRNSP